MAIEVKYEKMLGEENGDRGSQKYGERSLNIYARRLFYGGARIEGWRN